MKLEAKKLYESTTMLVLVLHGSLSYYLLAFKLDIETAMKSGMAKRIR